MPTRQTALFLAGAGVALASGLTHAQEPGEVIIEIDRPMLLPGESATVRLLAGFDSTVDFAMAGLLTDLLADARGVDVGSAWSDVVLAPPMNGPGTSTGTPVDGGFEGILAGQLNFPLSTGYADPMNPIPFWEATFTAPLDAGAFEMDLSTRTTRFDVYADRMSSFSESRLDGLTEGAGRITVVPAPATVLVLIGLVAHCRRR